MRSIIAFIIELLSKKSETVNLLQLLIIIFTLEQHHLYDCDCNENAIDEIFNQTNKQTKTKIRNETIDCFFFRFSFCLLTFWKSQIQYLHILNIQNKHLFIVDNQIFSFFCCQASLFLNRSFVR
jgi:hypothetical protein